MESVSRAVDLSVGHGEIFLISEVVASSGSQQSGVKHPREGSSVKLLGFVEEHDPVKRRATIALEGSSIEVDTGILAGEPLKSGMLYHIIGELIPSGEGLLMLRGRVSCDALGLDVDLFKQALAVRRSFLNELQSDGGRY